MTIKPASFIFFLLLTASLMAGVGGKLSGEILSDGGTALADVNVIIRGTDLGTAADSDGHYYILNIPPGSYDVQYSSIGYKTLIIEEISIQSDFTTLVDVELVQSFLESEEVVTVTAERPLIQKDATSKVVVVTAEEMINMPVENFKDVLATRAGFTTDAEGGMHVRGGRTKEILYMIDGMIVEDPMEGDFTGTVNQNAIQEMSVISGTFNAEYGQAMSAIVNLVTKDGGEDFSGHLEYISDQLNDFKYHQRYAFGHVLDSNYTHINLREKLLDYYSEASSIYPNSLIPLLDLPISGSLSTNISGSLGTSKLNYFGSFLYKTDENPLPHGVDIRQDSQLKLTYAISPRLKLAGHIHSSAWLYQNYSHRWKYRPENQAHNFKTHDRFTLKFTHSLSEALFYSLAISRSNVGTRQAVQDKPLDSYEKPLTDESVYFYSSGDQGIFTDNLTKTSSLNYNMTYQANKQHLLESGFTLSRHWLDIHHEEQPWPDGANFVDDTTFTPIQGSFYLQDKIELDYIILNLGLRYDYLDPASGMWENISQFGTLDEDGNFTPAKIVEADPSSKWSPRIGIAYPLSDRTVFHFSYGHFFQSPNFNAITYNARKDVSATLALVGNPHIKPQKTVSFETGLKQALSRDMSLEVTAWMKDIHDLLSTVQVKYLSRDYVVYENSDYASVKGIDLSISKRQGQNLAGSVNYTLSVAKGNNSEPLGGYFSAYFQEEIPHQEYFLDFDQRHDISIDLNYNTPVNSGMEIFGWFPFSGVNTNILINAASGLPYTPYVDPTFRVDVNSARKPWTYSVDLRMKKRVAVGRMSVTGFLEVINLTDHKNVLTVFSKTGKPFDSGESGSVGSSEDANHNPAAVGPGRTIKFGTTLEF